MKFSAAVVDTNVVVAGLLTRRTDSPTARILDGMRLGGFPFLLSSALLRPSIRKLHGLKERELDDLLTSIAANAIVREPKPRTGAPDVKDNHLWSLVQSASGAILVTGDLALIDHPTPSSTAQLPRDFVDSLTE